MYSFFNSNILPVSFSEDFMLSSAADDSVKGNNQI